MTVDTQFGFTVHPKRIKSILGKFVHQNFYFTIPLFQREYSWSKNEIHKLLNQLLASDDNGHFVGTIFTTRQDDKDEVIDGQQRLTTFSLLILALCVHINNSATYNSLTTVSNNLKEYLFLKSGIEGFPNPQYTTTNTEGVVEGVLLRLTPGTQNNNRDDYIILLNKHLQLNVNIDSTIQSRHSTRKMNKSFVIIQQWLTANLATTDDLALFIKKVQQTRLVLLQANSTNSATDLFDGLNNTGLQLSVSDIIKNKVIQSYMNYTIYSHIDSIESYELWENFINNIDIKYQSLYLKHLSYVLRFSIPNCSKPIQTATEKELPNIYENILQQSSNRKDDVIRKISEHSEVYKSFLDSKPNWIDSNDVYMRVLFELDLVEATPSLALLLYLSDRKIVQSEQIKVAQLCCKIFARQHITSQPKISYIDNVMIKVINKLAQDTEVPTYNVVKNYLLNCDKLFNLSSKLYSSDDELERALKGPIYDNNSVITRYLLIKLASSLEVNTQDAFDTLRKYEMTSRQGRTDRKIYTIEHVLPQGNNLSDNWINALSECNPSLAVEILHETYKHKLGNLTLTADNSALSTRDFAIKQKLTSTTIDRVPYQIGYKNGDPLNNLEDKDGISLSNAQTWNTDRIEQRTATMVKKLMSLLSLNTDQL